VKGPHDWPSHCCPFAIFVHCRYDGTGETQRHRSVQHNTQEHRRRCHSLVGVMSQFCLSLHEAARTRYRMQRVNTGADSWVRCVSVSSKTGEMRVSFCGSPKISRMVFRVDSECGIGSISLYTPFVKNARNSLQPVSLLHRRSPVITLDSSSAQGFAEAHDRVQSEREPLAKESQMSLLGTFGRKQNAMRGVRIEVHPNNVPFRIDPE
jgi:hypothetical protein